MRHKVRGNYPAVPLRTPLGNQTGEIAPKNGAHMFSSDNDGQSSHKFNSWMLPMPHDGVELAVEVVEPSGDGRRPKADVIIVHGYGDHQGRYVHLRNALGSAGYRVWTYDCRGHGRSGGRRGHVDGFQQYGDDLQVVMGWVSEWRGQGERKREQEPLFLLGHSQGGCIVLDYLLRGNNHVDGVIVSAPMLRLKMEVCRLKELTGRLMAHIWPSLSLPNGLTAADFTHSQVAIQKWNEDPLVCRKATVGWYVEAVRAMARVRANGHKVSIPCLCMVAGDDPVVSSQAVKDFFMGLGSADKSLKEYDGFFHEIFNEVGNQRVIDDVIEWLDRHK